MTKKLKKQIRHGRTERPRRPFPPSEPTPLQLAKLKQRLDATVHAWKALPVIRYGKT